VSGADDLVEAIDATATAAPSGADWQLATVSATGTGTVSVTVPTGTITPVRRLASYTPTIGDVVAISRNGAGNWLCLGKLA